MRALLAAPRSGLLSFDVNWRPGAVADRDPAVLRELAALADVVLVGADEAESLWGVAEPAAIREVLPEPRGARGQAGRERGATLLEDGRPAVFQPALRVDVVEPVGAGDAFAAGFLAATARGRGTGAPAARGPPAGGGRAAHPPRRRPAAAGRRSSPPCWTPATRSGRRAAGGSP